MRFLPIAAAEKHAIMVQTGLWGIRGVPFTKFDNSRVIQLTQHLNRYMRGYGYQSIDLPIIEAADLFLIKAGDQIVNKLFTFERHGQQLALRPEFTAAAAYHYMAEYGDEQPTVRWQFSGYVFEDDPNNFAQNHQRFSIGAEMIGMYGPVADAEIISMSAQGLTQQNIHDWQLTLGHVGLIRQALAQFKLDSRTERFLLNHLHALKNPDLGKAFVLEQVDKLLLGKSGTENPDTEVSLLAETNTWQIIDIMLDTTHRGTAMGGRTRQDIARRLLQKRQRSSERQQIVATIDFLVEWSKIADTPREAFAAIAPLLPADDTDSQILLTEWETTVELLSAYDIPMGQIKIQPDLARFWDYYTGIVFEIRTTAGVHLGGGGRYDELSKLLGGSRNVPAVGFAYYADEIIGVLSDKPPANHPSIVIVVTLSSASTGIRWANQLRQQGFMVELMLEDFLPNSGDIVLYANEDKTINLNSATYPLDKLINVVAEIKCATS